MPNKLLNPQNITDHKVTEQVWKGSIEGETRLKAQSTATNHSQTMFDYTA